MKLMLGCRTQKRSYSSVLSTSVMHFLPTNSDSSSCLLSAMIVAATRHDLVPQSSGSEQSPSILSFSSPPVHPTTGEFLSSVVRLIALPTSMIMFSHDFVLQSDWYCLYMWQAVEINSFCSECCQAHSSLVF